MTEKKELIQQLKETDPDTYKKYRLEYMKSLFDLKKFQFLFLKNNQSRTWTENYMKKLLSKRKKNWNGLPNNPVWIIRCLFLIYFLISDMHKKIQFYFM